MSFDYTETRINFEIPIMFDCAHNISIFWCTFTWRFDLFAVWMLACLLDGHELWSVHLISLFNKSDRVKSLCFVRRYKFCYVSLSCNPYVSLLSSNNNQKNCLHCKPTDARIDERTTESNILFSFDVVIVLKVQSGWWCVCFENVCLVFDIKCIRFSNCRSKLNINREIDKRDWGHWNLYYLSFFDVGRNKMLVCTRDTRNSSTQYNNNTSKTVLKARLCKANVRVYVCILKRPNENKASTTDQRRKNQWNCF